MVTSTRLSTFLSHLIQRLSFLLPIRPKPLKIIHSILHFYESVTQ